MSEDTDWIEKFSKTHERKYFYNRKTKKTSWDDPRAPPPALNEKEKDINEEIKIKQTFFDFLMECLRNEVTNEFVWDRRYDDDLERNASERKDFAFYWISKVPYIVKEVNHDLGVAAIISLYEKNPSIVSNLSDIELKNKLCGFQPCFEFNLAAFAAFVGVQTPPLSSWRDAIWKSVYRDRYNTQVAWNVSPETWNMISKVRVTLCVSYKSRAGSCFMKEMQAFMNMISQIK